MNNQDEKRCNIEDHDYCKIKNDLLPPTKEEDWAKINSESIIADIVNMTTPCDDQMKTVRYLRSTLPKIFFLIEQNTLSSSHNTWKREIAEKVRQIIEDIESGNLDTPGRIKKELDAVLLLINKKQKDNE